MAARLPHSFFAPAGRAAPAELRDQEDAVAGSAAALAFGAAGESILVLNRQRQIVAANGEVAEALGSGEASLVGLRPGEALGCVHAWEEPGGCGTSRPCAGCGAVLAILASIESGGPSVKECLLTVRRNGRLEGRELRVRAAPLRLGEQELTVFVFQDISAEKRQQALERVFLHDLANLLGALRGWAHVAGRAEGARSREAIHRIGAITDLMAEELSRQRSLLEAERGELVVRLEPVLPSRVLERLHQPFASLDLVPGRRLALLVPGDDAPFVTDETLLVRVLGNMVKNALEATPEGGEARVSYDRPGGRPTFSVWNAGTIPHDVALRVFTRSFSTKGTGRGVGTYSMRLFGETYLGGEVRFTSRDGDGTTFTIALPPLGPVR